MQFVFYSSFLERASGQPEVTLPHYRLGGSTKVKRFVVRHWAVPRDAALGMATLTAILGAQPVTEVTCKDLGLSSHQSIVPAWWGERWGCSREFKPVVSLPIAPPTTSIWLLSPHWMCQEMPAVGSNDYHQPHAETLQSTGPWLWILNKVFCVVLTIRPPLKYEEWW